MTKILLHDALQTLFENPAFPCANIYLHNLKKLFNSSKNDPILFFQKASTVSSTDCIGLPRALSYK